MSQNNVRHASYRILVAMIQDSPLLPKVKVTDS
jgi:hypothetical protein